MKSQTLRTLGMTAAVAAAAALTVAGCVRERAEVVGLRPPPGPPPLETAKTDWESSYERYLPVGQLIEPTMIPQGTTYPWGVLWVSRPKGEPGPMHVMAAALGGEQRIVGKLLQASRPRGPAVVLMDAYLDLQHEYLEDAAPGRGREFSKLLADVPAPAGWQEPPAHIGVVSMLRNLTALEQARRTGDLTLERAVPAFPEGRIPAEVARRWNEEGEFTGVTAGPGAPRIELRRLPGDRYVGRWAVQFPAAAEAPTNTVTPVEEPVFLPKPKNEAGRTQPDWGQPPMVR